MARKKTFDRFQQECCEALSPLQDEFVRLYEIKSYDSWFYDHGLGVFHFASDDGRNLYFKYIDVGSYSTNTNSWMWSWRNPSTPKYVTTGLEKVRAFGADHQYNALTQGVFEEGDEYTGWAFTAITAKLTHALGAYRIPQKHLYIYFVFTNELTQAQYDALKSNRMRCDTHGPRRVAFVCQHLLKGDNLGFHESFESDPSVDPDEDYWAWCDACEAAWLKQGDWTSKMQKLTKMKLVCDQCYFERKDKNSKGV